MRLGRLFLAVLILGGASAAAFTALSWHRSDAPVSPPAAGSIPPALATEGARLVALGNCADCHTAPGGRPYAGGVAIQTPYGHLFSTNITPDTATGIGAWSLAAFTRAMRTGISRDGHHLYPAFPYPHYAALSEHEIAAIYAYLMTRKPISAAARDDDLAFPFNIRALVAVWNLLYWPATVPPPEDAGGHIAEGIAHCGACHTPRNQIGAERTESAYAGADVDGWHAPALGAASPAPIPWTEAELALYLSGGVAPHHGVAAGPMQAVTANLAFADPADLHAIAAYIAGIGGPADPVRQARATQTEAILSGTAPPPPRSGGPGAEIYAGACAICHQDGWHTLSLNLTPLALATSLSEASPRNALRVILEGRHPRESEAGPQMPGFANNLTAQQMVDVLAYLRTSIAGRPAWTDLAETVASMRREQEPQ